MHGVRIAEQVVQVAEDLLIRADQEDAEVVRMAVERMQRQRPLDVAAIDELIDLAVRVAGDVAEHRVARSGRSFSRWIGSTGKSCLMAQLSGIDWKSEKLQKYVDESASSRLCRSSGTSSICCTELLQLRADGPIRASPPGTAARAAGSRR